MLKLLCPEIECPLLYSHSGGECVGVPRSAVFCTDYALFGGDTVGGNVHFVRRHLSKGDKTESIRVLHGVVGEVVNGLKTDENGNQIACN